MSIPLLGAGHHLHASRRLDGFSSCVHRAELRDEHGHLVTAYVKAFPTNSKALPNEVLGWLANQARGIPCPARAWLILVPVRKLRQLWPELRWPGKEHDDYLCWATEEIPRARHLLASPDALIWQEVVRLWTKLPQAIAVNYWLHHVDANAGNLLGLDGGHFAVIDMADILGGAHWTARTLRELDNHYLEEKLLRLGYDGQVDPATLYEIELAAAAHAEVWRTIRAHVMEWWELLLNKKDRMAAEAWLERRASATWIRGRVG